MISVGRRDARKELGLGFGVDEREMDDTELEEGEAWSYSNNTGNDDFCGSIDPDIDLSYIDEKLQNVLGHFQKDFEGGVSAENLGAVYGGYGSFLPAYQRSPVRSQPKTPVKILHGNTSRSPNNPQLEGGRHSSVSSSNVIQSLRPEPASSSVLPMGVPRASCSLFESNKEAHMPLLNFSEAESANKKSFNLSDQKMLKVRIKVGSDNLSTRKNAAIYSGLGLDGSPTSSLDDSASESEGMSHEPQDALFESPFHIIQIMTSFPVREALYLSPLPDYLLHLEETERLPKNSGSLLVAMVGKESCDITGYRLDSVKRDRKMLGEKKVKSNIISTESRNENSKHSRSGIDGISRKEIELDTSACEELLSNTLKLPILSSSDIAVGDMVRGVGKPSSVHKAEVQDKGFTGITKEEPLMPVSTLENGWIENSKSDNVAKLSEDKKATTLGSNSLYSRKDSHHEGEKTYGLLKIDSNVSKGRKMINDALADPSKQISDKKVVSCEQEGAKLPPMKVHSSSEGKKKSNGSQSQGYTAVDASKESLRVASYSLPKNKKNICVDGVSTKGETEDFKSQKSSGKAGDRYRDFFGDMDAEQEENQMNLQVRNVHGPKDCDMVPMSTYATSIASKEKTASKKVDMLTTSKAIPGATSVGNQHPADGTISNNTCAAPAPTMEEDNWVCCDKCQKWRLLPPGTNPNDLPEKWVCSMLDWLHGMNRCSFSEEETSLATRSHFFSNPGGIMPEATNIHQPDQNHQNIGSHSMIAGGRKKPSSKESLPHKDGLSQPSNSTKKSISNGSLNGLNPSPVVSEPDYSKPSRFTDPSLEKHKHKMKEKRKALDNCSDGGGSKRSELEVKMDSGQDYYRASKKIRTGSLQDDWESDHGGATEKDDPSSSNCLPKLSSGRILPVDARISSMELQCDMTDSVQKSTKKLKNEFQVAVANGSVDTEKGNHTDRNPTKKRKVKESCDAQTFPGSVLSTGHHLQDSLVMEKEPGKRDHRKDKKATGSRSGGKEGSGSKGSGRTDKRGSQRKNQEAEKIPCSTLSERSLDATDTLKRESGSMHPSMAATSSSSKVSGSHKNKGSLLDVKGSPVESVSSSPMRVLKPDKLTSARKNATRKDGFVDAEDDHGSDRSGAARREKALDVAHHGSFESSILDFQENEFNLASGGKVQIAPSPDAVNRTEFLDQDAKMAALQQRHGDGGQNGRLHQMNGSRPKKYGKGSSSRSEDKNRNFLSVIDNDKVMVSDSFNEQATLAEAKPRDGKRNRKEKFRVKPDQDDNRYVDEKDPGLQVSTNNKRQDQSNIREHSIADVKDTAICDHDATFTPKHNVLLDVEMDSGRRKLLSTPPTGGSQNERLTPQQFSRPHKVNEVNTMAINASGAINEAKPLKQNRKVDHADGIDHGNSSSKTGLSNGHRARDLDAPSPVKRESSSQASTNALKEAKNLKHLADRLKNSGSNLESTKLYFEATLKFLHGASLLETSSSDNARTGEMIQSRQVYSSTAKLCEFCAHEYEKSKDLAAASLAYKCMEVAYMRVIYSSNTSANRDRHDLQMAFQMFPPGESPSSSASDIDNLNHPTTADKVSLPKGISSPQVAGSHIIAARNRPNFVRLLNFAQDLNFAMEASRKSRCAFVAACASLGEGSDVEGFSSIKSALDFSFHDVEGFLRLVRLALEAISR